MREGLAALELQQREPALVNPQKAVADGAAQPSQHAGLDQEAAKVVGQLVQHVARQVLPDESRAPGESREQPPALLRCLALRGQVEELETGGPALGSSRQLGQVAGGA